MINSVILSYTTFVYFASFMLYLLMMVMGKDVFGRLASILTIGALIAHTSAIILRWIESYQFDMGHAPFSNFYESLIFFAWAVVLLYVLIEWRTKNRSIGTFASLLAVLIMAYASFSGVDSRIQPLIPVLKSNWLITHVITCFIGYAAFGIAFCLSLMYLLKKVDDPKRKGILLKTIPDSDILEELNYQVIIIGFVLLTLGIITGSVWAHSAWGRYWGWDPKETWSLITWLVYAAVLHSRMMRGWRGKKMAILSMIGFFCVIFTYLGVNFILSGLHSYAT
ncbi:MAG: c-type cytochrome biogenesis protein CcsB [Deltaproteobacteria bacterium]|nr:c-type cytochrome biogenesis protein CcsB [Deltaproteobacteria bacterium]